MPTAKPTKSAAPAKPAKKAAAPPAKPEPKKPPLIIIALVGVAGIMTLVSLVASRADKPKAKGSASASASSSSPPPPSKVATELAEIAGGRGKITSKDASCTDAICETFETSFGSVARAAANTDSAAVKLTLATAHLPKPAVLGKLRELEGCGGGGHVYRITSGPLEGRIAIQDGERTHVVSAAYLGPNVAAAEFSDAMKKCVAGAPN